MKFGETLSLRSVPQWQNYNLDYIAIKQLIKEHTTPGKGKAVAIPGRSGDVNAALEVQLLQIFTKEHSRLSLFVKSKNYEISSRLGSIDRQLSILRDKRELAASSRHGNLRARQRLLKIESEILKVGQEIQNLARFISINRQAIRKLVKKYHKWGKSTTFGPMIEQNLLSCPDSFAEVKMKPLLQQYTTYLGAVRSPFEDRLGNALQQPPSDLPDAVSGIDEGLERQISINSLNSVGKAEQGPSGYMGTGVDFDIALDYGSTPLQTREATYWVHQDNLVELRVLLLQYLRYAKILASSRPASSALRPGTAEKKHLEIKKEDAIGELVFEIGPSSAVPTSAGNKINKPVIATKWAGNGDAILCLDDQRSEAPGSNATKMKRRARSRISDLFEMFNSKNVSSYDLDVDEEHTIDSEAEAEAEAEIEAETETDFCTLRRFRECMQELPPTHCVSQITSKRSRFVGLENSNVGERIWAALDEEVTMSPFNDEDLKSLRTFGGNSTLAIPPKRRSVVFPHAVLTLRAERGVDGIPALMSVLDQSHLTERVYGYSPEAHAMILFSERSSQFERPEWFSQLDKDIRHIPKQPQARNRSNNSSQSGSLGSANGHLNPSPASANGASTLTPITVTSAEAESPMFNQTTTRSGNRLKAKADGVNTGKGPLNEKGFHYSSNNNNDEENSNRLLHNKFDPRKNATPASDPVRYWNEYDYPASSVGRPAEAADDGIFVEPERRQSETFQNPTKTTRIANWFKRVFNFRGDRAKDTTTEDTSSISSFDSGDNVLIQDKTPLLAKTALNSDAHHRGEVTLPSSYDTFAELKRYNQADISFHHDHEQPFSRKTKIVSTVVTTWVLLLGAGVLLESASLIAVGNCDFSQIGDESRKDGVYMALVIMGVITGFLLVFASLVGLLRVWIAMRARVRARLAEKRRQSGKRAAPFVYHSHASSHSSSSSAEHLV